LSCVVSDVNKLIHKIITNTNINDIDPRVLLNHKFNLGFDAEKMKTNAMNFLGLNQDQEKSNETNTTSESKNIISMKCLSNNTFTVVNNKHELRKIIKLTNDGNVDWPIFSYLTNISTESTVFGPAIPIKIHVIPGKEINVEVCFDLTKITTEGIYKSVWKLQNIKRETFGESIVFTLNVKLSDEISIKNEFVQVSKKNDIQEEKPETISTEKLLEQLNIKKEEEVIETRLNLNQKIAKMRASFDLTGVPDYKIIAALAMTNGEIEGAITNLCNSKLNLGGYQQKSFR